MPGPDFTRQLEKWKKEAEKWVTESELARSRFSRSVSVTQETARTKSWLAAAEEVIGMVEPVTALAKGIRAVVTGKPRVSEGMIQSERVASALKTAGVRSQEEEKADFDLAVTNLAKASWYADFYSIAPAMVEQGLISSLEEYGQKMLPPTFLTPDEVAEVRKSFSSMVVARPTKPEELPEFLRVPEKKQAAISKFLTAPTITIPITLNSMTVNEILKSMRTPAIPAVPKDLGSPEEILANAKLMGYTEEQLKESSSLTEYVKVRSQRAKEWEQKIADVKAGLAEWGMPETDWRQKAITAITQPATTFVQVIEPAITNISYPSTGLVVRLNQTWWENNQGLQKEYEKLAAGKNIYEAWIASGKTYAAWAEDNLPLLQRLIVEAVFDPLNFFPGKAISIPAKGLIKAGAAMEKGILPVRYSGMAIKLAGERMLWLNQGAYNVLDIPVKGWEKIKAKIPLAFSQTTRRKVAEFTQDIFGTTGENVGKLPTEVTVPDISKTLDDSVAALKADPTNFNSKKVQLGSKLREFVPADKATIESWAKKVDGDAVVTREVITDVNDIITDFKLGVGTAEQNGKRLAVALGAEDTPTNAARLAKQLDSYVTKFSIDIEAAKEIGRTAKEQPRLAMISYLAESYSKIARAAAESEFATGKRFDGIILALQQAVDAEERNSVRLALDKYAVRTLAEAGLGNVVYAPYNAIETMLIMAAEGTNPFKFFTAAEFTQSFTGLVGIDPRLFDSALRAAKGAGVGGASDVAGMIGTMPGRSQFSILPSDVLKVPETIGSVFGKPIKAPLGLGGADWIKWLSGKGGIELSDLMGTYQRMSFLIQKYHQHLRVLAADYVINGVNVLEAIERIASNPPVLSRGASLGITPEWLTKELTNRALTSDSRIVQAMKELLTNGYLQQKELQKLIRLADWLSPQAKDTAMRMIAENKVLLDADSIIDFVKTLADQSIADLKAAPTAIPDNFKYLAGLIEQTSVANKKDLAVVLREYLVMSETASNLPSAMIERAFDETRKLRSAGKYDQVRGLWNKHHEDLGNYLESINASLEQVKAKALANSNLLPPEQAVSMKALLDRFSARNALHEQYFKADRAVLDEYWSLPKNQREAQWNITDTARVKLHSQFKNQDAVLGVGDFMAKKEYNDLFWNLPEERIFPVDATSRALSSNDVARILGTNVDGVSRALAENVALQQREYFTQLVLKHAEARPDAFKGVTEAKVSAVYDEILRGMSFDPGKNIGVQRILQGAEELKLKLINQQMIGSLLPGEEKALHGWIDDGAEEVSKLFGGKGGAGIRESWTKVRQKASDQAHVDMYRAFADYTNQNIFDAQMKMLLPYWTYEFYRWTTGLPRLALKHPGISTTWGKYIDYTDRGHIQLPGTDLSVNPFTSSIMGVTFGLARKDYQSYYSNLGQAGEAIEIWERYGFYPNALIRGAVALTPTFSGRPPELGTIVPPIGNLGMELMTASKIPGVVESMEWLRDHIFHENFRNYYVATKVTGMQADAGGDLIDGQNGTDLWHKIQRKEELEPEEKELWETASRGDVAIISAARSQFPQLRLKEDEQIVAVQMISRIFEEYAGMSEKYQQNLWRNNLKPTDMMGGLPLELRPILDQLWQWKLWMGRGQILMAPELSDLYNRIDEYWDRVKQYQKIRIEQSVPDKYLSQNDINEGWLNPTKQLHFDGGDWVRESANTWQNYTAMTDALKLDPRFKQATFAITPEGQVELAKKLGFSAPVRNPLDEAIDLYFSIQLKKATDKYTGEEDWDFAGFWLNKESVRMALTKEQRHDFDAIVRKYETIPERLYRQVQDKYLRGYRAVPRILLKEYDEEQKALIAEYYSNTTSMTRKEEIRATTAPSGKQLISDWEKSLTDARAKLRLISPMLDFWLYVYKGTKPKTPAAVSLAQQYDTNRNMVLDFIDWNPPTTEE